MVIKWAFTLWNKSDFSDEDFELLLGSGYSVVEISLDSPWPYSDDFKSVIRAIDKHGLELAFHAPWRDVQLASPYPPISKASAEVIKDVIDRVAGHGPGYMVLHAQTREWVYPTEEYVKKVEEVLMEIATYAESRGMQAVLENTGETPTNDPSLFRELIDGVGIRACLDVGRLMPRSSIESFPLAVIESWINALGSRISVVHLHRTGRRGGRISEHFSIVGAENTFYNIVKRVHSFSQTLTATLEVFYTHTGADANARYLAEMLAKLLSPVR